jgi:hypothetical protein
MNAKSKLLVAAVLGATLVSAGAAEARPHFWPGVAAGAVGGLIVGSAIANANRPAYYYGEPGYYADAEPEYIQAPPPPRRVYRSSPNCVSYTKYDINGQPFEWKDCN